MAKKQKQFAQLQQALFTRSAKMMSYELRTRREVWDAEMELRQLGKILSCHSRHSPLTNNQQPLTSPTFSPLFRRGVRGEA